MPLQIQINQNASFEDVKAVEVPKPTIIQDNHVLVKFLLNPINPSDIYSIQGVYPGYKPESYPAVPGLEGVAQVEEVGKFVSSIKVGQRVIIVPGGEPIKFGTWTNYGIYIEDQLFPVPDNVPSEAAAQVIVNPSTAYVMLDTLDIPRGEYILQSAAGSVLGRILIEFAKRRGVKTINLVRSKEQIEELKAIGADEVLSTEDGTNIVAEIKRITNGKLAYGAIDAVGGELGLEISSSVRDDGIVILYGVLGDITVQVNFFDLIIRHVNYTGFSLPKHFRDIGKKKIIETSTKVFELLGNGVEPLVGTKYPFEQVAEAIQQSLKPGRGGKVLLVHS